MPTSEPTIKLSDLHEATCLHCSALTVHVGPEPATPYATGSCLQCIADGGTCCTLRDFDRWKPPTDSEGC